MTTMSAVEASQNWDRVTLMADQDGQVVILENDRPKYLVVDLDQFSFLDLTDDEKIDIVAARVLRRFKPAFLELAK